MRLREGKGLGEGILLIVILTTDNGIYNFITIQGHFNKYNQALKG